MSGNRNAGSGPADDKRSACDPVDVWLLRRELGLRRRVREAKENYLESFRTFLRRYNSDLAADILEVRQRRLVLTMAEDALNLFLAAAQIRTDHPDLFPGSVLTEGGNRDLDDIVLL